MYFTRYSSSIFFPPCSPSWQVFSNWNVKNTKNILFLSGHFDMCKRHVLQFSTKKLHLVAPVLSLFFLNMCKRKFIKKTVGLKIKSKFIYFELKTFFRKNSEFFNFLFWRLADHLGYYLAEPIILPILPIINFPLY